MEANIIYEKAPIKLLSAEETQSLFTFFILRLHGEKHQEATLFLEGYSKPYRATSKLIQSALHQQKAKETDHGCTSNP